MISAHGRKLIRERRKRHLRVARAVTEEKSGKQKKNSNIVLPDTDQPDVNKLNSSEVIRLTVVITDKKKKTEKSQGWFI